jgi:transketolase
MPEVTIAPPNSLHNESRIVPECRSFGEAWIEAFMEISKRLNNTALIDTGALRHTLSDKHLEDYHTIAKELPLSGEDILASAIGLASQSTIPFVSIESNMSSGKIFDILKNTLKRGQLNIKIANFSNDPTLLQLLLNIESITVIRPADFYEAKKLIHESAQVNGIVYIGMPDIKTPTVTNEFVSLSIGQAHTLREGSDITLICSGQLAYECYEASRILEDKGIKARFVHLPCFHPLDQKTIIESAENTEKIVVIESNSDLGILHKQISHMVSQTKPVHVHHMEIATQVNTNQSPPNEFGLHAQDIAKYVQKALEQKI